MGGQLSKALGERVPLYGRCGSSFHRQAVREQGDADIDVGSRRRWQDECVVFLNLT